MCSYVEHLWLHHLDRRRSFGSSKEWMSWDLAIATCKGCMDGFHISLFVSSTYACMECNSLLRPVEFTYFPNINNKTVWLPYCCCGHDPICCTPSPILRFSSRCPHKFFSQHYRIDGHFARMCVITLFRTEDMLLWQILWIIRWLICVQFHTVLCSYQKLQ